MSNSSPATTSAITRRAVLRNTAAAALMPSLPQTSLGASQDVSPVSSGRRPAPGDRRFRSEVVEQFLVRTRARIADPVLAELFVNCFPNTLDTTVEPGYALTSTSDAEIGKALAMLKSSTAGMGFMHESYFKDGAKNFTRAGFAWANTLFGELIATLASSRAHLLRP